MKEVTDPQLIAEFEAAESAAKAGPREVTDPGLLRQFTEAEKAAEIYTEDGKYRVIDGDTVLEVGSNRRLRLSGVNSPERGFGTSGFSKESLKQALDSAGPGVTAKVSGKDAHGRELAEFIDARGNSVNRSLVQSGAAPAMRMGGQAGPYEREDTRRAYINAGLITPTAEEAQQLEGFQQAADAAPELRVQDIQYKKRQPTLKQDLGRGVRQGVDQLQGAYGGLIALTGSAMGNEALRNQGMAIYERNQKEAGQNAPSVGSIEDIEGVSDFFHWASGKVGNALPSMAEMVGTGGAGGVVANRLRHYVTKGAVDRLVAQEIPRGVAERIVRRKLQDPGMHKLMAQASVTGGVKAGVFAGSATQQQGDIYGELSEAGIDAPGTAAVAGGLGGYLDTLPVSNLLDKFFPGTDRAVAKNIVARTASLLGQQAVLEGGTEGLQEVIAIAARAYEDPSFEINTTENKMRVYDAAAAGALIGALTGGATGALAPSGQAPAPPAESEPIPETQEQIDAQAAAVLDPTSEKDTMLVTPGSPMPSEQLKMQLDQAGNPVQTDKGTVITTDLAKAVEAANAEQTDATMGQALYGAAAAEGKPADADRVVEAQDAQGQPVTQIAAGPSNLEAAHATAQAHAPVGGKVVEKPVEQVLAERIPQESKPVDTAPAEEPLTAPKVAEIVAQVLEQHEAKKEEAAARKLSLQELKAQLGKKFKTEIEKPEVVEDTRKDTTPEDAKDTEDESVTDEAPEYLPVEEDAVEMQTHHARREVVPRTRVVNGVTQNYSEEVPRPWDIRGKAQAEKRADQLRAAHPGSQFEVVEQDGGWVIEERFPKSEAKYRDAKSGRMLTESQLVEVRAKRVMQNGGATWKQTDPRYLRLVKDDGAPAYGNARQITQLGKDLNRGDVKLELDEGLREGAKAAAEKMLWASRIYHGFVHGLTMLQLKNLRPLRISEIPGNTIIWAEGKNTWSLRDITRLMAHPRTRLNELLAEPDPAVRLRELLGIDKDAPAPTRKQVQDAIDDLAAKLQNKDLPPDRHGGDRAQNRLAELIDLTSHPNKYREVETMLAHTEADARVGGRAKRSPGPNTVEYRKLDGVAELADLADPELIAGARQDTAESIRESEVRKRNVPDRDARENEAARDAKNRAKTHRGEPAVVARAKIAAAREEEAQADNAFNQARARQQEKVDKPVPELVEEDFFGAKHKSKDTDRGILKQNRREKTGQPVDMAGEVVGGQTERTSVPVNKETEAMKQRAAKLAAEGQPAKREVTKSGASVSDAEVAMVKDLMATVGLDIGVELADERSFDEYTEGVEGQIRYDGDRVTIYISKKIKAKGKRVAILAHELGHAVAKAVYDTLPKNHPARERLQKAWKDSQTGLNFEEWMANQFVAWAARRQAPKNIIETFFKKVAQAVERMLNKLRTEYGLNETYAEFIDGIASQAAQGVRRMWVGKHAPQNFTVPNWVAQNKVTALAKESGEYAWNVSRKLARMSLVTADSWLRTVKGKNGKTWSWGSKLANHWNLVPGASVAENEYATDRHGNKIRHGLLQEVQRITGVFENKLDDTARRIDARFKHLPRKQRAEAIEDYEQRMIAALHIETTTDAELAQKFPEALEIRKLLRDMRENYLTEHIPVLGKIQNYFPQVYNLEYLEANRDQFIAEVAPHLKSGARSASAVYDLLMDNGGYSEEAAGLVDPALYELPPGFKYLRNRGESLKDVPDEVLLPYLSKDLAGIMNSYIRTSVKRAESDRRFGDWIEAHDRNGNEIEKWHPTIRLERLIKTAERDLSPEEFKRLEINLMALRGLLGASLDPKLRHFMGYIMTYQNYRTLVFSAFASIPDLAGIVIKSHDLKLASKAVATGLKSLVSSLKGNPDAMWEMSRAMGVISEAGDSFAMQQAFSSNYISPNSKKFNDWLFKANGLHHFTMMSRVMALAAAKDFVQSNATKARNGDARAKRYLKDLGITEADVAAWDGKPWDPSAPVNANAELMSAALNKWVNGAILRPDSSMRPAWGSDARAMLVFHLKSFMYAFQQVIMKGVWNEMKARHGEGAGYMSQAAPALVAVATLMPLAMVGIELRNLLQHHLFGTKPTYSSLDVWDLMERTGGMGAVGSMGADIWEADTRNRMAILAPLGPTANQLEDLMTKPWSQSSAKLIPLFSQVPGLRTAWREAFDFDTD